MRVYDPNELTFDSTKPAKYYNNPANYGYLPNGQVVYAPNGYAAYETADPSNPSGKTTKTVKVSPYDYGKTTGGEKSTTPPNGTGSNGGSSGGSGTGGTGTPGGGTQQPQSPFDPSIIQQYLNPYLQQLQQLQQQMTQFNPMQQYMDFLREQQAQQEAERKRQEEEAKKRESMFDWNRVLYGGGMFPGFSGGGMNYGGFGIGQGYGLGGFMPYMSGFSPYGF